MRLTSGLQIALAAGLVAAPPAASAQDRPWSLAWAVERALDRHPSFRAAEAQRDAAQAGIGEARATLWPQLRADASALRFEEPMVVAPLHGFNPQSPPDFDRTLLQLQLGLSHTLVDGGQRRAAIHRAEALHARGVASARAARAAVVVEAVRGWLEVAGHRAVLRAEDLRLEALGSERERVRQFLESGRAAPVDQLRIDAAVARAEADRADRQEALQVAEAALARLTGSTVAEIRNAAILPLRPRDSLLDGAAIRGLALDRGPDLEEARARVAVTAAAAEAASASWWPEIRVVAGYTDYSSGQQRVSGEWQAGLRAGYPLLSGGGRQAAARRTTLDLQAAEADLEAANRRVSDAVDRAVARARGAASRAMALARAVAQYEEVARIEALALEAGAGTQASWITAEADLLGARAAWIEARQAEVAARVELARLAGTLTAASLLSLVEEDR